MASYMSLKTPRTGTAWPAAMLLEGGSEAPVDGDGLEIVVADLGLAVPLLGRQEALLVGPHRPDVEVAALGVPGGRGRERGRK